MSNIAIIGASGLVGRELIKLFEKEKKQKLFFFASEKSKGIKIAYKNYKLPVLSLTPNMFSHIDIAFFAAGSKISKEYIPIALKNNTTCIDLSSYYRMQDSCALIIPEINPHILKNETKLISSPNCTTTIMLMAVHFLHKKYKIKRIVTSTYQAASGGGKKLIDKLINDTKETLAHDISTSYGFNLFLHDSKINDAKYSAEEEKIQNETNKILNSNIKISSTCVRVPVIRAHSMSLNIEFEKDIDIDDIYSILKKSKGIKIFEDYEINQFASPNFAASKKEVFISRIRIDKSQKNTIDMWVVADQILKGASLNAFQIYKKL